VILQLLNTTAHLHRSDRAATCNDYATTTQPYYSVCAAIVQTTSPPPSITPPLTFHSHSAQLSPPPPSLQPLPTLPSFKTMEQQSAAQERFRQYGSYLPPHWEFIATEEEGVYRYVKHNSLALVTIRFEASCSQCCIRGLQSDYAAIPERSKSDSAAILQQFRSDSAAIAKRLQSDFVAIAQRWRIDSAAIVYQCQSDCKAIPQRLRNNSLAVPPIVCRFRSDSAEILQRLCIDPAEFRSICKASPQRLCIGFAAISKRFCSESAASPERLQSKFRIDSAVIYFAVIVL
jgi:hypothetical protein